MHGFARLSLILTGCVVLAGMGAIAMLRPTRAPRPAPAGGVLRETPVPDSEEACAPRLEWSGSLAWSPEGRRLAVATDAGKVEVWRLPEGERLAADEPPASPGGLRPALGDPVWLPDGRLLSTLVRGEEVTLWEGAVERVRFRCMEASWSPDRRFLSWAEPDGKRIRIWDEWNGLVVGTAAAAPGDYGTLYRWSPDGRTLAFLTPEWLAFWRWGARVLPGRHRESDWSSFVLRWSPDGRFAALFGQFSGFDDDKVYVLDGTTGRRRTAFGRPEDYVLDISWSPDGRILAVEAERIVLWDVLHSRRHGVLRGGNQRWSPDHGRWSHDGRTYVSGEAVDSSAVRRTEDAERCRFTFWDTASGKRRRSFVLRGEYQEHSADPTSRWMVAASGDELLVWEFSTGRLRRRLAGWRGDPVDYAWSPDGRFLVSRHDGDWPDWDDAVVWDLHTGAQRAKFRVHDSGDGLQWSPDGRFLAAVQEKGALVWERTTGQRWALPR